MSGSKRSPSDYPFDAVWISLGSIGNNNELEAARFAGLRVELADSPLQPLIAAEDRHHDCEARARHGGSLRPRCQRTEGDSVPRTGIGGASTSRNQSCCRTHVALASE